MVHFRKYEHNQDLDILFIDSDFEFTRRMLKVFAVDKRENNVFVVNSGLEALDYMFQLGRFKNEACPIPNIILLDFNLPDINGFSLLAEIRKNINFLEVPVIIFGKLLNRYQVKKGRMLGAVKCVHKPAENDLDEFVCAVSSYCSKSGDYRKRKITPGNEKDGRDES